MCSYLERNPGGCEQRRLSLFDTWAVLLGSLCQAELLNEDCNQTGEMIFMRLCYECK